MNASLQMLVEPMMFVITPLDRTGVNVQMDLLLIPVHRTHWIQFVSVRRWIIKKWQKERTVRKFTSGFLPTFQKSHKVESVDRAIFVWPWKMVSVSVRYLFYQPMDEKIKTWPLRFPAKENPNMEKALFDWPIVLQHDVKAKYLLIFRKFSGMTFFHLSVRLTNQNPRAFVSVR